MTEKPLHVQVAEAPLLALTKALNTPNGKPRSFAWLDRPTFRRVIKRTQLRRGMAYVKLPDGYAYVVGSVFRATKPIQYIWKDETGEWDQP